MSILEDLLIILEQEPHGSLPVFEVKARVTERLTNPKRLADEMRAARESLKLGVPLQTSAMEFGPSQRPGEVT